MFKKIMDYIDDFLKNTPKDIYEFSVILEDALVDDYDKMYEEQPKATEILADEPPFICASAEPDMKPEEIEEFKRKLKIEYDKRRRLQRGCVRCVARFIANIFEL